MPTAPDRRRTVRVAVRLGVLMLSRGALSQEVETSLRDVMRDFGFPDAEVVVTHGTVSLSVLATVEAEATTAIRAVRAWQPDFSQLAASAALVTAIRDGDADLDTAEAEIDRILHAPHPYPRWLRFAAPALLSFAVTIMFGGSLGDAAATLAIGLAIQPALEWIERSELPQFFQVVVGVASTVLIVVLLVDLGVPIEGSLVLTGSLLRFLPGAGLVSGMHELISGALIPGVARLAEVALIGVAITAAASLILTFGERIGVQLEIDASGAVDWWAPIVILAGAVAVVFYAVRVGVPRRALFMVAGFGAAAVFISRGYTPLFSDISPDARTLTAAILIGVGGSVLAYRQRIPSGIWTVPAILPLLPAPATLLPLLADTETGQQALQGEALQTAFAIGAGVASGSILVITYHRYWARVVAPVADALSDKLQRYVARPAKRSKRPRRHRP
jgi:uncharacterized membrane protein YjjP (DUF1212 family)